MQLEYVPERIAPVYVSFYPKMKNIPKNKSGDRLLSSRLKKNPKVSCEELRPGSGSRAPERLDVEMTWQVGCGVRATGLLAQFGP